MAASGNGEQIGVGAIERARIKDATQLLARAFEHDPVIGHFMRPGLRRRLAFPGFFGAAIEAALPAGHVYQATRGSQLAAVAIWFAPDAPPATAQVSQRAARAMLPATVLYPRATRQLLRGFSRLERHHPPQPHWYLAFVGVEPELQDSGIGAQLLRPVLTIADETDALCYLETPFPRTHPFYARLGFERAEELRVFDEAPPVVTFVRRPRPTQHTD